MDHDQRHRRPGPDQRRHVGRGGDDQVHVTVGDCLHGRRRAADGLVQRHVDVQLAKQRRELEAVDAPRRDVRIGEFARVGACVFQKFVEGVDAQARMGDQYVGYGGNPRHGTEVRERIDAERVQDRRQHRHVADGGDENRPLVRRSRHPGLQPDAVIEHDLAAQVLLKFRRDDGRRGAGGTGRGVGRQDPDRFGLREGKA